MSVFDDIRESLADAAAGGRQQRIKKQERATRQSIIKTRQATLASQKRQKALQSKVSAIEGLEAQKAREAAERRRYYALRNKEHSTQKAVKKVQPNPIAAASMQIQRGVLRFSNTTLRVASGQALTKKMPSERGIHDMLFGTGGKRR